MDGAENACENGKVGSGFAPCDKAVSRIKACVADFERTMIRRSCTSERTSGAEAQKAFDQLLEHFH